MFGITYQKIRDVGIKWRALKAKQDCSFWSSAKPRKGFSKINYSVKYSLQRWIISHPHVIQSHISNDCITVKFDGENGGVNTELLQKVILRVSVRELHTYILKMLVGFPWNGVRKDFSVLVIMIFDEFFHKNYEI